MPEENKESDGQKSAEKWRCENSGNAAFLKNVLASALAGIGSRQLVMMHEASKRCKKVCGKVKDECLKALSLEAVAEIRNK